ncbi:MAG: RNA polymerase sigma factor, partial [Trebonia sp.]
RAGDAAAFRLLVERHRRMALARAVRLGARPVDTDDIVQEAFLQAFTSLDRLRDPDRFGAWLAGIVLNVYRAAARRPPSACTRAAAGSASTSSPIAPTSSRSCHGGRP